jgi:hypothetical protein
MRVAESWRVTCVILAPDEQSHTHSRCRACGRVCRAVARPDATLHWRRRRRCRLDGVVALRRQPRPRDHGATPPWRPAIRGDRRVIQPLEPRFAQRQFRHRGRPGAHSAHRLPAQGRNRLRQRQSRWTWQDQWTGAGARRGVRLHHSRRADRDHALWQRAAGSRVVPKPADGRGRRSPYAALASEVTRRATRPPDPRASRATPVRATPTTRRQ